MLTFGTDFHHCQFKGIGLNQQLLRCERQQTRTAKSSSPPDRGKDKLTGSDSNTPYRPRLRIAAKVFLSRLLITSYALWLPDETHPLRGASLRGLQIRAPRQILETAQLKQRKKSISRKIARATWLFIASLDPQ
jgi:hypothetical protein